MEYPAAFISDQLIWVSCSKINRNIMKNSSMKIKSKTKYKHSGVVPFRIKDGILEILLVKTKSKKKWITPKGKIEDNMTPQESALKEAEEEGGIKGVISGEKLGDYTLKKDNASKKDRILMFPMEVTIELEDYKEKHIRERKWCSMIEVLKLVTNEELKQLIQIVNPSK